jgi:hypothetical protein
LPCDDNTKKNYREADGAVKTAPRNFTTFAAKKGHPATTPGTLFTKEHPEHMKDEYDRKKEIARKEHEEGLKKRQEKPFSQRIKKSDAFSDIEHTYGEEGMKFPKKKPGRVAKAQVEHPGPFRPSNPSKQAKQDCTLAKFPEYLEDKKAKEDPNYGKPRQKPVKKDEERPQWRPNTFKKSIPSPSVATNMKNIRSSLPAMMRR